MTAVTATHRALEQYLRRATAGLPTGKRQEVWDELEEHVYCRAEQLQWQGVNPKQALKQALRELGPPLRVSAAMNGVHNMPKMIAFATLTTLAISGGLYALAQQPLTSVSVPVVTSAPKMQCVKTTEMQPALPLLVKDKLYNCYQDDSRAVEGTYISLSEVNKYAQKLGIKTGQSAASGVVSFSYLGKRVGDLYPAFKRGDETYLDAGDLFSAIMSGFPIPVTLYESEHPVVQIGNVGNWSLEGGQGGVGKAVYKTLDGRVAHSLYDFSRDSQVWSVNILEPDAGLPERTLQTRFAPGEVVAAYHWKNATPGTTDDGRSYRKYDVVIDSGTVDAQGKVVLHLPEGARFVSTAPTKPGDEVLLVRLTHTPLQNIKSGIFLPEQ